MKVLLFKPILLLVVLVAAIGIIIFVLSIGKVECINFIDKISNTPTGCGVYEMEKMNIGETTYKKYVVYGIAQKVFVGENLVLISLKVPLSKNLFFRMRIRVLPFPDEFSKISKEYRKWLGYFDNSQVENITLSEKSRIEKEIGGKEIMATMIISETGILNKNWEPFVNNKRDILSVAILIVKGLLNKNIVDVYQVGY